VKLLLSHRVTGILYLNGQVQAPLRPA